MADEITVTTGLKINNGQLKVNINNKAVKFNQTTDRGGGPGTVDVGTSEESISFGDITPGWVHMVNLDATNYVSYGTVTGNLGMRMPANGPALIYLESGETLYVQANTAACKVQVTAANT